MPGRLPLLTLLAALSVGLVLALAAPAAAAAPWDGEEVLFPLPELDGVSVAGSVAPHVPLSLLGVEVTSPHHPGAERRYQLMVRNDSERPVTAWSMRIHTLLNQEPVPGSTGYRSETLGLRALRRRGEGDSPVILPGEVQAIDLPILPERKASADRLHYRVELEAVVFEDTSFSGDPAAAAEIFLSRGRDYARLIEEAALLRSASELPARFALDELEAFAGRVAGSDASAGTHAVPLPVSRATTRAEGSIHILLAEAREEPARAPELVRELATMSSHERRLVEVYTPSAFLDPRVSAQDLLRFRSSPRSDAIEKADGSCSLIASKSGQTKDCGSALDGGDGLITVTENWSFTCQPFTANSSSETLNASGHCALGKECPPLLEPPVENVDVINDQLTWYRSYTNRVVLVPTLRCGEPDGEQTVFAACPCPSQELPGSDPEPAPSDGSSTSDAECSSPILVDLALDGLHLTGLGDPVSFDLDADGTAESVAWTAAGVDDAFLVLDRNGNGRIDDGAELFGDHTEQPDSEVPHGLTALALFDRPEAGGNDDGWISAQDEIFGSLELWRDLDHDGVSDPGELMPLAASRVERLGLQVFETRRRDRHGNWLRFSSMVHFETVRKLAAVDVLFRTMASTSEPAP